MSVIRYLDELEAAIFESELDGCGSGIERVLDELFNGVGGAVDNLLN